MAFASPFRSPLTRLDRYIFRQVLLALVAVTVALVALIWLTQSLRFVELIVNRGLSPFVFLRLTALLVPSFVAVILPITTFVVVQFVYQRLAGDRELTVMRAAGQSPLSLAKPTLFLAVAVAARPASRRSANTSSRFATGSPPSCCRRACSPRSPTTSPSTSATAIRTAPCMASWWMTSATRPMPPPSSPRRGASCPAHWGPA
jgi:hypothetical protein